MAAGEGHGKERGRGGQPSSIPQRGEAAALLISTAGSKGARLGQDNQNSSLNQEERTPAPGKGAVTCMAKEEKKKHKKNQS